MAAISLSVRTWRLSSSVLSSTFTDAGVSFQSPAPKLPDCGACMAAWRACTRMAARSVGEPSEGGSAASLACSGSAAHRASVNSVGRKQGFIRFVFGKARRRSDGTRACPARRVRPLLKAPYAGASRIRFQGTLSACLYRHPRFGVHFTTNGRVLRAGAQAAARRASLRRRPSARLNHSAWPSRKAW